MGATVKISGLRELGASLKALGDDVGSKIARQAVAAGASVIKRRAKELAPIADEPYRVEGNAWSTVSVGGKRKRVVSRVSELVQPGNVPKQIVTKRLKPGQTNLTAEYVVAVRGKRQHGFASYIGALLEFGTVKMEAKPFMRPAFEQEKGFAVREIVRGLKARIDKANKGGR